MKIALNGNTRKYGMLLGASLLAALLTTPALADNNCGHQHQDSAKHGEMFQKRVSELHANLHLTQAQETHWNTFVEKLKPTGQAGRHHERSEWAKLTAPERMDRVLAMQQQRLQRLETRTQAVKEFYAQLSPEQQKTFDESFHHRQDRHSAA